MKQLKIVSNGGKYGTKILDADSKEISGLAVEKLEVTVDAKGDSLPTIKLTLVPGSCELDLIAELDGVQKDLFSEFANKLFVIQDSLHGKSLDSVQNEIYEIQRQMEIMINRNSHEIVKFGVNPPVTDIPTIKDLLENQSVSTKNRMAYCTRCDATHQITNKDGYPVGIREECLVAIFNLDNATNKEKSAAVSIIYEPSKGPNCWKCSSCGEEFKAVSQDEAFKHRCTPNIVKTVEKEFIRDDEGKAIAVTNVENSFSCESCGLCSKLESDIEDHECTNPIDPSPNVPLGGDNVRGKHHADLSPIPTEDDRCGLCHQIPNKDGLCKCMRSMND